MLTFTVSPMEHIRRGELEDRIMSAKLAVRSSSLDASHEQLIWKPVQGRLAQARTLPEKYVFTIALAFARDWHFNSWIGFTLSAFMGDLPDTVLAIPELFDAWSPVVYWPDTPVQRLLHHIMFEMDADSTESVAAVFETRASWKDWVNQAQWPTPDWEQKVLLAAEIWESVPFTDRQRLAREHLEGRFLEWCCRSWGPAALANYESKLKALDRQLNRLIERRS